MECVRCCRGGLQQRSAAWWHPSGGQRTKQVTEPVAHTAHPSVQPWSPSQPAYQTGVLSLQSCGSVGRQADGETGGQRVGGRADRQAGAGELRGLDDGPFWYDQPAQADCPEQPP